MPETLFGKEVWSMPAVVVSLSVRDLAQEDLPWCSWSGSALHLTQVARELKRSRSGVVDYLAVCPPSGRPVGIGGVDYEVSPGAGTLWQLAVLPALQSCGIGTVLVHAAPQACRMGRRRPGRCHPAPRDQCAR